MRSVGKVVITSRKWLWKEKHHYGYTSIKDYSPGHVLVEQAISTKESFRIHCESWQESFRLAALRPMVSNLIARLS